jgi:hypothetical protein
VFGVSGKEPRRPGIDPVFMMLMVGFVENLHGEPGATAARCERGLSMRPFFGRLKDRFAKRFSMWYSGSLKAHGLLGVAFLIDANASLRTLVPKQY